MYIRSPYVSRILRQLCPLAILILSAGFVATANVSWAQPLDRLVLVDEGVSLAPIIVYGEAPPRTVLAAEELAEYMEAMSGVRPEVWIGEPESIPARAIWVGYQSAVDGLFPNVDFNFEHPEEIILAANGAHLVISGRDRWNPDAMDYVGRHGTVVPNVQQEYGTVNAVYTFLQDHLGVRWYWPGETGIDIPQSPTIAVEDFSYRYHPQIRQRSTIFRLSALDWGTQTQDWSRYQRLLLDSMDAPMQGHGFGDWWRRYSEDHPDYFALQPDGTRSGFPGGHNAKLCASNPAVWEQIVDNIVAELEENPNLAYFNISPNDSYHRGHCVCDDCRAWDHPEGEYFRFVWQGISQEYVAMSDRDITFANHVGRTLKRRLPDHDISLVMFAYGWSCPAPIEAVPDDNVIVCSVANFLIRDESLRERHLRWFDDWSKVTDRILWRPNLGGTAGWRMGLPFVPIKMSGEDMTFIGERGCIGICPDTVWEHWSTHGPLYYLIGQMAWDPTKDPDAILEDYYRRAFGPAAGDVEAYWSLMEELRDEIVDGDLGWEGVIERMGEARQYLDAAAAKVASYPDSYGQRVDFVRAGLDWTDIVLENIVLAKEFRDGARRDQSLVERVDANWEKVLELRENYPYALHWSRLYGPPSARATQPFRQRPPGSEFDMAPRQ